MGNDIRALTELLEECLSLNLIGDEDDVKDYSTKQIVAEILGNYSNEARYIVNNDSSYRICDIRTYIDLELSSRFELLATDINFNTNNLDAWLKLLLGPWTSIDYALALQIIVTLSNTSLLNKMRLKNIAQYKPKYFQKLLSMNSDGTKLIIKEKFEEIYSLILTVSSDPEDIFQLYNNLHVESSVRILNTLAAQLSDPLSQNYLQFENSYHIYEAKDDSITRLTLHLFIELNNVISNRLLTIGRGLYLEIKETQFCISNDEFIIALFTEFEFEPATLYSISVVLENSDILLYVNGNCLGNISLFQGLLTDIGQIDLGSMICSFKLYRFFIFKDALSEESLQTLHAYGGAAKYFFDEGVDIHQLVSKLDDKFISNVGISSMTLEDYIKAIKMRIESCLVLDLDPTEEDSLTIIDLNGVVAFETNSERMEDPINQLSMGACYKYKASNLLPVFISVNCFRFILGNLEKAEDMDYLFNNISHLITLLQDNHLRDWFRKEYGYAFLSYIIRARVIKKMGKALPIQFLNLFLEYCGWDLINITKSFITDETAYYSLVLNFDLWHFHGDWSSENNSGLEILRFLLFQICTLLENSKYQRYNSQKLRNLNVLGWLCNTQHLYAEKYGCPNILNELRIEISQVYFDLLKDNPNKKSIQWLLQHSYFELRNGYFQNSDVVLSAVDRFCFDVLNENNISAMGILNVSLSPKFLLMILNETVMCHGNILLSLNLLFKLFLINKSVYNSFVKNGGMDIVLQILRNAEVSFYEDIIYLMYIYSLGDHNLTSELNIADEFTNYNDSGNGKIILKELLITALELLEWAVINDIKDSFPLDLENFLCIFLGKLSKLLLEDENIDWLTSASGLLFNVLFDLLITLKKPQNSLVYDNSAKLLTTLLENHVLKCAKSLTSTEFERFFTGLSRPSILIPNDQYIPENNVSRFEQRFSYMILPGIIEGFERSGSFGKVSSDNTDTLMNLLHIFDSYGAILQQEAFDAEYRIKMFHFFLGCAEFTRDGYDKKTLNKNNIITALLRNTLALMYQLIQDFNTNASMVSSFYENLYKAIPFMFDIKYGAEQISMAKYLFHFLLLGLKREQSTSIFQCLDFIACRYEFSQKYICDILAIFEDKGSQSKFLIELKKKNMKALIGFLDSEGFYEKGREAKFMSTIREKFKLKACCKEIPANSLKDEIIKDRQLRMENKYTNGETKQKLFQNDNINLDNKLNAFCVKYYSNFIADNEDDDVAHCYQYDSMICQFLHMLSLQLDQPVSNVWSIDSVQDHEIRKGRLIPILEMQSNFDTQSSNVQYTTLDQNRGANQERKVSTSIQSYDLISDFDSIDLATNNKKDQNRKVLKVLKENDTIKNIWNTSLVVGLDTREGILICGVNNLYFVKDYYFMRDENKVVNIEEIPNLERDTNVSLITGSSYNPENYKEKHEVWSWSLADLIFVTKRPFLLRDAALELLMENGTNCFFSFKTKLFRDEVYYSLDKLGKNENIDPVLSHILQELNVRSSSVGSINGISKASFKTKFVKAFSNGPDLFDGLSATAQWQRGEISNFYYLAILNILAGRTFNDITQYPVFPWVIADYTSEEINLTIANTFRDFSKPMGGQSKKREMQFKERYEALESLNDPLSLPFHYGTHYSSAMIVSSFLIRLKPYVDSFLLLQDGKFGHADRLFNSIERAWTSAAVENTTDVRELTPEFFFMPEFLINMNNYNFGKDQNGIPVLDVNLPPWAKKDPKIFIWKNREALESPYVSAHLHQWIDLIFGCKQRGEHAKEAVNVFNSFSYPGAVDLDNINDENERRAVTGIIHNFGQTPLQIFQGAHPQRKYQDVRCITPDVWTRLKLVYDTLNCDLLSRNTRSAIKYIIRSNSSSEISRWQGFPFLDLIFDTNYGRVSFKHSHTTCGIKIAKQEYKFIHCCPITAFLNWKKYRFITGDTYGLIKIWDFSADPKRPYLTHLSSLYGHLSEIKDLRSNEELNILLAIDGQGFVYVWDLINYQIIRKLPYNNKQIAISQYNGTMATCTLQNKIFVYNNSGMFYTNLVLPPKEIVSCLAFLDFSNIGLGNNRHMYWKEKEILLIGFENGTVKIFELVLTHKLDWELQPLISLETSRGEAITSISSQLRENAGHSRCDDDLRWRIEIIVGNSAGELYVWE